MTYGYDALNRLIRDGQPNQDTETLTYYRNGNRTAITDGITSTSSVYLPNSNQLSTLADSTISHDLAGNRTSDQNGNRTFEYNHAGRLFKMYESGTLIATYTYNYQGQRTRKVTASGTTVYHYDLNGSLISETDELGTPIRDVVYRKTVPIAQIDVGLTEFITYLHSDHLGTPRRGTDENGIVVWSWDSDAFGAAVANDDSDGDGVRTVVNLRFPEQYYDEETGLHYNYFRYYDPATGRYITSDPIGLDGGLNTYLYVSANPLKLIDPLGLLEVYGNWCGPNWTGGYSSPWDELTQSQQQNALPPIDELDSCCSTHDRCHASCRENNSCDGDKRSDCFQQCDRELASCAGNSGNDGFWSNRIEDWMEDSNPGPGPDNAFCNC